MFWEHQLVHDRIFPYVFTITTLALWPMCSGCSERAEQLRGNPTAWKLLKWVGSKSVPGAGADKRSEVGNVAQPTADADTSLPQDIDEMAQELEQQRQRLFAKMKQYFDYSSDIMSQVEKIIVASPIAGQGNPKISEHPMKRSECMRIRQAEGAAEITDPLCNARNMTPVYDTANHAPRQSAPVCIDQFEFPNIPCEYPVVHVSAMEAALLCKAVGKRLCDAHEWEGACAGNLRPIEQEYAFGRSRRDMKHIHNNNRDIVWAYGKEKNHALCATSSKKSESCHGGGYRYCGSNTYPAGAFPKCVSTFGVYDLHGNAAEHMNLPLTPDQLASKQRYGETEMKGSWFIFNTYEAHLDDCHWRAPDWHVTKVMSPSSHSNYHLGFRCCKNVNQ